MSEIGKRYNPVGRTEAFTDQVKNSVRAMYERGYFDGKNDTKDNMKDVYQRGYEDGRKSNEVTLTTDGTITVPSQSILGVAAAAIADDKMGYKHGYDDGYQRGLDDMQNALLAIDKWNNVHKALVFHGSLGSIAILRDHNSKYIVDEVRKYQEEQAMQAAKIAVGDEVTYHDDRGVVTMIANNGQTIRYDPATEVNTRWEPQYETTFDKIISEIEREADYQDAEVNADIAKGMYKAIEIVEKYKTGVRDENT